MAGKSSLAMWTAVAYFLLLVALAKAEDEFPLPDEINDADDDAETIMSDQRKNLKKYESPEVTSADDDGVDHHRNIHLHMSTEELKFHFGVTHPKQVDPTSYQIIRIYPAANAVRAKRGGGGGGTTHQEEDAAAGAKDFEMTAFGRRFKVPMRPNDKMMKFGDEKVKPSAKKRSSSKPTNKAAAAPRMSLFYDEDYEDGGEEYEDLTPEGGNRHLGLQQEEEEELVPAAITGEDSSTFDLKACMHMTHSSEDMLAAVSQCEGDGYRGFITDMEKVYEINPLSDEHHGQYEGRSSDQPLHVVVRRDNDDAASVHKRGGRKGRRPSDVPAEAYEIKNMMRGIKSKRGYRPPDYTIELGLFVDHRAYTIYNALFNGHRQKMINMLLSVINGVQAVYHYPSLGKDVDISLVHVEIHDQYDKIDPTGSERDPKFGEQAASLNKFCKYQSSTLEELNAQGDEASDHWDAALLISGHNFWGLNRRTGKRSYSTMGLSYVGGMCNARFACTIAEMGVKDHAGKPYPSCGFTSVFVIAHELGHNLGMSHDIPKKNGCDKNGFIMSPSRGTTGEVIWSKCSRNVMWNLDKRCLEESRENTLSNLPAFEHNKFGGMPGLNWTADSQCRFYTQKTAVHHYVPPHEANDNNICMRLNCKEVNGRGYYSAGPALEGTLCGENRYCMGGKCQYMRWSDLQEYLQLHTSGTGSTPVTTLPPPPPEVKAEWSNWGSWSGCTSSCILYSKGAQYRKRDCIVPQSVTSFANSQCKGSNMETRICDFACKAYQKVNTFADNACREFPNIKESLIKELTGSGKQYSHSYNDVARACTVYCQKSDDKGLYYSPVLELPDIQHDLKGVTTHFPDGTHCNSDPKVGEFYCKNRLCVAENPRGGRMEKSVPVINFNLNARPDSEDGQPQELPEEVKDYFTLNEDGQQVKDDLSLIPQTKMGDEEEFILDDDTVLAGTSK